jgi:ribosome recycling factor
MDKVIDAFKRDLSKVRTGRASAALLDGIRVEYYGTMTPLNQVASVNVPDPRLITIKPWEKTMIPVIEKAIKAVSELGLNPVSDGELVRIPIPPLTQERRKELVKVIKKMAEEAKVGVRNARRDANEMLKEYLDSGDITEDDKTQGLKKVQELTDKYTAQVDEVVGKKEKEVMEV